MKLHQISAKDELTGVVIRQMMERSSILQFAEFYRITGNAEFLRKAASASGGQFRQVNNDYPENIVNPVFINTSLKILGDVVLVDQANERRGLDISSMRAAELINLAQSLGRQMQKYFFNGDSGVNVDEFDGLKKLISANQRIVASANGLSIDTGNSDTAKAKQQKFIELLEQLIESVDSGAQVIFMDGRTLARLTSIAREFITTHTNEFGAPVKYYNGIPILTAGYDKNGQRIISHTETCGTSANCTSVYAVRFGERSDLSFATNVGLDVQDLGLVNNFYTHKVEMDISLSLLNEKSAARIEGLIIP